MRIGLISQWYDPEPGPAALPAQLARGLHARGHQVQVLTAFPNYPTGRIAEGYTQRPAMNENLDGVDVRRTAVYANHDHSAAKRMLNYASFGVTSAALGTRALRDCDAVWVNYSPITVALPMWLTRYAMRIPQVVHVLDLWPDTVLHSGFAKPGRVGRAADDMGQRWCNAMYAAADSVAYIAPGVGRILAERGVPDEKLSYVPMWADETVFRPHDDAMRRELGLSDDDVVLLYAGAMGEAQNLAQVIEAAAQVTDPRLKLLFAGSGIAESSLRSLADSLRLTNTRFIGRFPQTEMTRLLGAADASLISLRSHPLSKITMPSKMQAGLAAGRALFVVAEGDVSSLVTQHRVGLVAEPADSESVSSGLGDLARMGRAELAAMGDRARQLYQDQFSVAAGVTRVEGLLERAAERGTCR